jgi:pimeloyl-ACP methyl ester carboxylesterase
MDAIVAHAYGFIRAVGITRAIVAGHSRGALPAARIAADHSELVSHLIIFDTNTLAGDDATITAGPDRSLQTQIPTREQIRAADMKSILSVNKAIVTDAWVDSEFRIAHLPKTQLAAQQFAAAKQLWMTANAGRIAADPGLLNDEGPLVWWLVDAKRATLDAIRNGHLPMPTALIWGWNDNFAPLRFGLSAMDTIAKANPNTEMHIVNHASHFVFAEQPIEVTRLINSFIRAYPVT